VHSHVLIRGERRLRRILDKHLAVLAPRYFETKFMKIHAPDAPFFCHKLKVQVLPCVIMFRNGVAFDRLVGFEELGFGKDDFKTAHLEMRLGVTGAAGLPSHSARVTPTRWCCGPREARVAAWLL